MNDDSRLNDHREWINSRIAKSAFGQEDVEFKAGAFSTGSRAGQTLEGLGSALLPGDMSNVRSPGRSAVWSALTPGGIRKPSLRRALTQEREYRCPEGYQYGGRFTDSKWSTCGRQLFDLPTIFPSLLRIAENAARQQAGLDLEPNVIPLTGQQPGYDVVQSRRVQIPRVGPMSKRARELSARESVRALVANSSAPYMMVRRDGFPMMPVVSVGELRKVPDNRNMEDAVFLMQAANIDMLGKEELGLLSNTGVTTLMYVLPNGSTIRMDRTRPLTVGERRKLGKTVSSASTIDNQQNPLARLNAVVSESSGAISVRTSFENIGNPNGTIQSGKNQGKPRWSVEAFKPATGRTAGPSVPVDNMAESDERRASIRPDRKITNVETAIEHINRGGNLSDISPSILTEAIQRANVYRRRSLGRNRVLYMRRGEGVSFLLRTEPMNHEGIGADLHMSLLEHFGLPAPKVRVAGEGPRRPYLVESGSTISPQNQINENVRINDLPASDLATILLSDYLTDVRDRNPASIIGANAQNRERATVTEAIPTALAGLDPDEIKGRFRIDLPLYLRREGAFVARDLQRRSEAVRRQILAVYAALLQRARAFDWDNYLARIKADGQLSQAETRHMDIVRQLFEQRLKQLATAQKQFAELLGL